MKKNLWFVMAASVMLTACAGESSRTVMPMQKKDKQLSCREVLLEMNEAEFTKNEAIERRNPGIKTVIMPLGYVSTYMNAEDAINSADARISYLDKIYEIMQCDGGMAASSSGGEYGEATPAVPVPPVQSSAAAPQPSYKSNYKAAAAPDYASAPAEEQQPYSGSYQSYTPASYSYTTPPTYDQAYESYVPIRERFERRVAERGGL